MPGICFLKQQNVSLPYFLTQTCRLYRAILSIGNKCLELLFRASLDFPQQAKLFSHVNDLMPCDSSINKHNIRFYRF